MKRNLTLQLDSYFTATSITLAIFFLVSTIYGGIINHTSVPFADTWDGAINFYLDSKTGFAAWWQQHNEHRILLARLLFWIDLELAGGNSIIYLPIHLSLLLLLAYTFFSFYKKITDPNKQTKHNKLITLSLCLIFALSWMQRENIVWEFQGQFILAYLLPLLALFFYAKSLDTSSTSFFSLSLFLAWLSAYAMINGLLALPLLTITSILCRDSAKRIVLIFSLAILSFPLFFIGYEKTPGSSDGMLMLTNQPLGMIYFALIYLGNPIYIVTQSEVFTSITTACALIYLSYVCSASLKTKQNPFTLALLAYTIYICLTAAATAFGRSHTALEFAASSRYTTPTLTFWLSLSLIFLARKSYSSRHYPSFLRVVLGISILLLTQAQISALYYSKSLIWVPFNKEISALSLQLKINDSKARKLIAPLSKNRKIFFERARQAGISIFSEKQMFPANLIGSKSPVDWEQCNTQIKNIFISDKTKNAYQMKGRILSETQYKYVIFSNQQDIVTGVALAGSPNFRDDLNNPVELSWLLNVTKKHNFMGYSFGNDFTRAHCK